jgi:hypothetical protein
MMRTAEDYRAAWETERKREYPVVDAFEARCGYALSRTELEAAARVLACPVKKNPPNWQHGRVLFARARKYLERDEFYCGHPKRQEVRILDIGTAKGFSALCLQWALNEAESIGRVTSVDVIDPYARVKRNTIAECDGLKTLHETLRPWSDAQAISFAKSTGLDWLDSHHERIHIAFVDGSHDGDVVLEEGRLLVKRQEHGDIAIFDDVDRADISDAIHRLGGSYRFERIEVLPNRHYAIGVRR